MVEPVPTSLCRVFESKEPYIVLLDEQIQQTTNVIHHVQIKIS